MQLRYNLTMKTYLVTGGLGFIGLNFIKKILENNDNFVINLDKQTYASNSIKIKDKNYKFIKGDICDRNIVDKIFKKNNIDFVVNFAAESHVDRSIENANQFYITNVLGTLNLLNIAKKYWKNDLSNHRFIQISTDEVYGDSEIEKFETSPLQPTSPYASSKASADLLVLSYIKTYNFPAMITRSSNNFGKYQFPEKLIPKFFVLSVLNKSLSLYFKNHIRDWLYVEDNVNAINLVLNKGKVGEIYNICANNQMSNEEITLKIINFVKNNINQQSTEKLIAQSNVRLTDDKIYNINCDKIKSLGFKTTNFDENLEKTLNFYKSNFDYLLNQFKKITN